jgi:hypothetical protein
MCDVDGIEFTFMQPDGIAFYAVNETKDVHPGFQLDQMIRVEESDGHKVDYNLSWQADFQREIAKQLGVPAFYIQCYAEEYPEEDRSECDMCVWPMNDMAFMCVSSVAGRIITDKALFTFDTYKRLLERIRTDAIHKFKTNQAVVSQN